MDELIQYFRNIGLSEYKIAYIRGFLDGKPDKWTQIVLMRCKGMTHEEIGEEVDISRQAVGYAIESMQVISGILKS